MGKYKKCVITWCRYSADIGCHPAHWSGCTGLTSALSQVLRGTAAHNLHPAATNFLCNCFYRVQQQTPLQEPVTNLKSSYIWQESTKLFIYNIMWLWIKRTVLFEQVVRLPWQLLFKWWSYFGFAHCAVSLFWSFRGSFCLHLQGDCIQLRWMLK